MADAGWISAIFDYDDGGMQLPITINSAAGFVFNAANYSASVYPFLTTGAAGLIKSFGSEALQKTYLPKMFSGEWQGTMALTEPNAGSSLSDITTTATAAGDGTYRIQGQKIYISCGDHDACDNVIHLMLARIKGAPVGVKGISLFVVPQKRFDAQGQLQPNDLQTIGVYHKMGYKGAPIAHLQMGEREDCHGYLVGEEHQGLMYMFKMMNEARIGVGMNAAGIASAAYYASLAYAMERPQGRKIDNKDLSQPQVPIIQHADVKRMLLFQRAVVDGSLALLLQASYYADLAKAHPDHAVREKYELLLDFLTPIAKTYPSEMGVQSTSAAVQCLGGAGYCRDFPVEQYYREARIHPIHEGTTGIHGLDLLGRKVTMKQGQAFGLFLSEVQATIQAAAEHTALKAEADQLQTALQELQTTTKQLLTLAQQGQTEAFLADATLYLELTGIIAIAWQWLKQGLCCQTVLHPEENNATAANGNTATLIRPTAKKLAFYEGKLQTMRYFFAYELPKTAGLHQRLRQQNFVTIAMQGEWFED
jgi:butyryl-CoA dehydrogenase